MTKWCFLLLLAICAHLNVLWSEENFTSLSFHQDIAQQMQQETNKFTHDASPTSQETLSDRRRFESFIHVHQDTENVVGYIYIGDHESSINESTWLYVKQALEYYKTVRPIFIILELNTPGGEVFAAQKISDALKEIDIQNEIPVVAFINNWAISAGAMLAYSSRFITAVKDASMGAAEPVYLGEAGKLETASEKVNSAIRADIANRANFFDRNPVIAEAMVDKDSILVFRDGKVIKLDNESQIRLTGSDPDLVVSAKGKLLTLQGEQLVKYKVADMIVPAEKVDILTGSEKASNRWPGKTVQLFYAPYFSTIPNVVIDVYKMDWKTQLFVFLASPIVSSLLLMGFLVGGYIELNHPGLSLPGAISAICLFLMVLSSLSLEIANWLELILLVTGLLLIFIELFVLPTFGLLGFVGILLFIVGLFGMLIPGINNVDYEIDTQSFNAAGEFVLERLAWLCGSLILSFVVIVILARYALTGIKGLNRLVLAGHEQNASDGFVAGIDPSRLPPIGARGIVVSTLRPAGKISVDGNIYDAVSMGMLIEEGEKIEISHIDGSTMTVKVISKDGLS